MGKIVIATYKPKPGKEHALDRLVKNHVKVLRNQGLATQRPPMIMKSADGTVVEVFEWLSREAIEEAKQNKDVQEYWSQYKEVCDIIPVSDLIETNTSFSEFNPFN
jgi:quinol monooxygenase YgiN